ncbi:MAG TPA: GTPase [Chloroflexia bacterium]|nr:GTPase [Chloroflexia bacterium]
MMRNPPPGGRPSAFKLPIALDDLRNILRSLDWDQIRNSIQREASARLAIVGPVNAGKSTLFNLLEGEEISQEGPIPGTTTRPVQEAVGPFMLVDTPGFGEVGGVDRANIAARSAAEADAILLLLDGSAGLRQGDADLLNYLLTLRRPIVVALNKIDVLGKNYDAVVRDATARLNVPVIPVSAKKGTNVGEQLVPALVDALPDLAIALGRELPALRRTAAQRVIRQSAAFNTAVGAEPIPFIDIPVLLTLQARMVLRIAAIYGESMSASHAKELMATIAGGLAFRYLAQQGAKLIPAGGWALAAGIAAAGTWAMGHVAIEYFESGKRLNAKQMRQMYKTVLQKDKNPFQR